MGRVAALAVTLSVGATVAGCGGNSASSAACSSIHAMSTSKSRLDRVDSKIIEIEKSLKTRDDLTSLVAEEKEARPIYRLVAKEAKDGAASADDPDLKRGWLNLAEAARLRLNGANVVIATFSGGTITASAQKEITRLATKIDDQNARWTPIANKLDSRFRSCQT